MIELIQTYQKFWEEAGIPASPHGNVPSDATLPYITYNYIGTEYGESGIVQSFLWTKSVASIKKLSELTGKIFEMIPAVSGRVLTLPNNKGALWLMRGTPFMQDYPQQEKDIKANYFVVEARTYII